MRKEFQYTFQKRSYTYANKHMKSCFTSLVMKETQVKTTMRYYYTLIQIRSVSQSCPTLQPHESQHTSLEMFGKTNTIM